MRINIKRSFVKETPEFWKFQYHIFGIDHFLNSDHAKIDLENHKDENAEFYKFIEYMKDKDPVYKEKVRTLKVKLGNAFVDIYEIEKTLRELYAKEAYKYREEVHKIIDCYNNFVEEYEKDKES